MRRTLPLFALAMAFGNAYALPTRPPRDYDLLNVEWHVDLDFDHASLTGDVINTVRPLQAGLTKVRFDSGPNEIASVTVDGKDATYNREGDGIFVDLGGAGQVKPYKVEIKYSVKPSAGAYFIPGARAYPAHTPVAYTQGEMEDNRYWLPTYDFPDNKATTEGYITVPAGYKALSNGALVGMTTEGNKVTYHWKQDKPMSTYLISLVAGPYDVGHDHWGKMDVSYWAPEGLLSWGKDAFGGTDKIIDFYSKITGFKYPWAKFAQAAVPDFMFGGMENVSAVTQTITALFPPSAAVTENSTGLVAHELAHQWFGDTVTCADWSHAWLNEGFATFMPNFWDRESQGEDAFERGRYGAYQGGIQAHQFQHRPVVSSDYELPIDNFGGFIYAGGASRLFMLVDKLGEPAFWKGVKDYLNEHKFQPVTTDQFFESMSKSSGVDLKTFEKQWLYTAATPHVTVSVQDGKVSLDQTLPTFDLQPWIWVLKDHKWTKKRVDFTTAHATYDMGDLTGAAVLLDPEGREMLTITTNVEVTADQALEIFKTAPIVTRDKFAGRMRMLQQSQLREMASEEKNLQTKETLIGMLTLESKEALFTYAKDSDPRIRLAALRSMGGGGGGGRRGRRGAPADTGTPAPKPGMDPDVEKLLTDAMKDPNDDVCNYAFETQLNKDTTGKLADMGWGTDSFREDWRNSALNWWAQHDKDKAREMALLALDKPMSEAVRTTAIRLLGNLKDKPNEHVVYDHLIAVIQEGSFGATRSALGALANYGNPAAIKYIEPLTHSSLHFMFRAANQAIARLKSTGDE